VTKQELDAVLTTAEAAELWGLSRDSLQVMAARGDFGENARRSGSTWLLSRNALERRYGPPRDETTRRRKGVPVSDLLGRYGLTRVSQVVDRMADFRAGTLWKEGRRWLVDPDAMDAVFGAQKRS
jgi:hypothetical protein